MLRIFRKEADRILRIDLPDESSDLVWIDLLRPTAEESGRVEKLLGLAIPSRDEMEEIELSSRLYSEDDAEFMTVTVLANLDTDEPAKTPVTFILKGATLVTVRHSEPKPFQAYMSRATRARNAPCASGEHVMLGIIELLIDRVADTLERVGNEIDLISRDVFRNSNAKANKKQGDLQSLVRHLGQKAELLTMIQESLVSISRLVTYRTATDMRPARSAKEVRQMIKLIQRDALSLGDHARALTARINFLLDATLGLINLEQNQIIKIFSVAAVVFLPPTLVASVYGMNFAIMPELSWKLGYPFAIGLMALSALLPFLYFKRRGWL